MYIQYLFFNFFYLFIDAERRQDGTSAQIYDVRWDTDMHGPVTRRLVNESHSEWGKKNGQSMTKPTKWPVHPAKT